MPPKGARGRAGARGGRGRGGKVSAPQNEDQSSQSTTIGDGGRDRTTLGDSTQDQIIQDASAQPSPNSSPVDIPTETPAPTPIRPDVQRTSDSRGRDDVTRGASSTKPRGDGSIAGRNKFKPKMIRRDLSEREKLKQAAENKAKKDREYAERDLAKAIRRGGRGGRGRGDAMGKGTLPPRGPGAPLGPFSEAPNYARKPTMSSSGAFSGPTASSSGGGFGGRSGDVGGASGSTNRIKNEGGTSTWELNASGRRGDAGAAEFYEPNYPGDEDGERIDIERINLISDDDEAAITNISKVRGKSISSKGGLRPVRLDRHEHKERVAVVNTDSAVSLPVGDDEVADDKDLIMIDDTPVPLGATLPDREWKGVFNDEDAIKVEVKSESDVPMALDSIPSPESKRSTDLLSTNFAPADVTSPGLRRAGSNSHPRKNKKTVKPVLQTEEDKAEYERHLEDVAILANELGGLQTATLMDEDRDIDMETRGEDHVDKKEGRLYLFQLPPILPPLCHPENTEDEVEVTGSKVTDNMFAKLEGQEDEVQIKSEVKDHDTLNQTKELISEEGFIGQLIVRESGKVELSWGGTNLVVGRGVESTFLSTVVVVDERQGMDEGMAMGMGQVMGKFVVTPDFEKMI